MLLGCKEDKALPNHKPSIALESIELIKNQNQLDSVMLVRFSYEDKNGDIGLGRTDTLPPFNPGSKFQFNLHVNMYDESGAVKTILTRQGSSDTLDFNQRIPNLTPDGKNKRINGEMTIEFDASSLVLYPPVVSFDLVLYDRALNSSNKIESGKIALVH
jgi:hypothetical protein